LHEQDETCSNSSDNKHDEGRQQNGLTTTEGKGARDEGRGAKNGNSRNWRLATGDWRNGSDWRLENGDLPLATRRSLSFNHSPFAIRYSLPFYSLSFTAHWATPP
jgi:hypothetical protein